MTPEVLARQHLPKRALALVLAGGRGSRLKQLTDHRTKPAVYFGGKFRIVDFALSNCLNSGIRQIGMVTQYKSHSLLRHLQRGWSFLKSEMNEFIDLLPAQQPESSTPLQITQSVPDFTQNSTSNTFDRSQIDHFSLTSLYMALAQQPKSLKLRKSFPIDQKVTKMT